MANEHAHVFGRHRTLVGIVTEPEAGVPPAKVAAIFINAGVVHRVGPNRMYVRTARALARLGFTAVRFDLSGLGDSVTSREAAPFEQIAVGDTREVMSDIGAMAGIEQFVLIGLCSGAVVAFRTATVDPRVVGAVLINPQGFTSDTAWNTYVLNQGRARRLFQDKLFNPGSWLRALSGRSDYRLLAAVALGRLRSLRGPAREVSEMAGRLAADFRGLTHRGVRLLLTCSEGDYALDYLAAILGADLRRIGPDRLTMEMLPAGDHSLTTLEAQDKFLRAVDGWAVGVAPSRMVVAQMSGPRETTAAGGTAGPMRRRPA